MTKQETRRIKYATLINAGLTPAQARVWRDRSNKSINEFYGIKIPKKQPKIKSYSQATLKRKQLEIKKYQYARERGLDIATSNALRKSNYDMIETYVRYETPKAPPKRVKSKQSLRDERLKEWSAWAKAEKFPAFIENIARKINSTTYGVGGKAFDKDASYGYTVAFYSYIENEDPEKWRDELEADRFTESMVYKTMTKRK